MRLFGYKILAKVGDNDEPIKLTVMDKYREHNSYANYDVYLCKDNYNNPHRINPKQIVKIL